MPKLKLNLRKLSPPEKVARAREIIAAMTGNANFPTPQPTLAMAKTVTDELEAAQQDQQAAKRTAEAKTAARNDKEDIFDRTFTQLAAHVESVAGDDEQKIKSAGMDTRAPAAPSAGTLDAPGSVNVTGGDADGEIDLSWEPVDGAKTYQIEQSPDPITATSWKQATATTKSKATIDGLTSGARYWFRVAAVGTGGQGAWSNPVSKIAP
ncbi:MAG: hypothetical protein QOK48_952 [Blastocatellia bacterium]|jgi:hypothetical protein|nr:hypothetical protein [Blastocatellia bacterium]